MSRPLLLSVVKPTWRIILPLLIHTCHLAKGQDPMLLVKLILKSIIQTGIDFLVNFLKLLHSNSHRCTRANAHELPESHRCTRANAHALPESHRCTRVNAHALPEKIRETKNSNTVMYNACQKRQL